jgi:hypothetical protein
MSPTVAGETWGAEIVGLAFSSDVWGPRVGVVSEIAVVFVANVTGSATIKSAQWAFRLDDAGKPPELEPRIPADYGK